MRHESNDNRIYQLLPAVYRERDAGQGYPLRALLQLVQEQADILKGDVAQLWDDLFIETCAHWVIPYVGDLVGNNLLYDAERLQPQDTARELFPDLVGPDLRPPFVVRTRADVAKTIYYRRRKGTLPMLEELARDVTGWPAHAVEFFQRLGWCQNLNHLRLFNHGCPDLRRVEHVDRLNSAFDEISHSVDVRHIAQAEGWYNIKNIGFFLWRLQSYRLARVPARPLDETAGGGEWRFHFSPLGNPTPLFSARRREGDESGLATERHIPGPIRTALFCEELRAHREASPPRPDRTEFYGLASDCSLALIADDSYIEPERIICLDLESWYRPPAGFRGILSGRFEGPFPPISSGFPQVDVTIGSEGPHVAKFSTALTSLEAAAGQLQQSIRNAHPSRAFRGTRVVVVDDRLLVVSGNCDDVVVFSRTDSDPDTVNELHLTDIDGVETVEGVLSGRLHPFPRLTVQPPAQPQLSVTIGNAGTHTAALDAVPDSLKKAAQLLQAAIRSIDPQEDRFAASRVIALRDRLLALPGTVGDAMRFGTTDDDQTSAAELRLLSRVGVDPSRGRIAFALHEEPPLLDSFHHYGFSADLGGGPYDRRKWIVNPDLAAAIYHVAVDGNASAAGAATVHTDLASALLQWEYAERPNAVIVIWDSRTYALPDTLTLAVGRWLVIEAANGQRPLLQTDPAGLAIEVESSGSSGTDCRSELTLSGIVLEGFLRVKRDLGRLRLLHATLVPGRRLTADGSAQSAEPSLIVDKGIEGNLVNERLRVEIAFSITGPLRIPSHAAGLWIFDSIVDGVGAQAIAGSDAYSVAAPPVASDRIGVLRIPHADGGAVGVPVPGKPDTDNAEGPPATLERVTVFGPAWLKQVDLASEVIFTEQVTVSRRQEGCVRFSFVPPGSRTPRRYKCQPDLESTTQIERAEKEARAAGKHYTDAQWHALRVRIRTEIITWLVPTFTAERYGLPGYAQLRHGCPIQIRAGAEDGSEMGAFCHLKQPQRETNLRIRLEEYLPFGLEAGILYVT